MRVQGLKFLLFSAGATASIAFVSQPASVARKATPTTLPKFSSAMEQPTVQKMSTNGDADVDVEGELLSLPARPGRPLKVVIAGGGVGGLTAALCMLKKGFDVTVYEKTAAFARFGGPIQFASNALSVLKEIDDELFNRVMEKFTFTGTRACGIKDGMSNFCNKRFVPSFESKSNLFSFFFQVFAPMDLFV
jgi:hypothetical protein